MIRPLLVPLGAALVAAAPALAQDSARDALRADLEFAKSKVYPALVNVGVVAKMYSGGRIQRGLGAGSGVIVGPDGLVVTNYHVAGDAERIQCTLPTGEVLEANVVALDPAADLAVLRLRLDKRAKDEPLPFATVGDSEKLRVGDIVLSMGNPLALSSSMTQGIVSHTKRVFTDFTGTQVEQLDIGGEATGMFTRWIQHDALILPGNSGGPLVNLRGEVVGINTRGGSGVGFATPSILVSKAIHQAVAHGEIRRGWLGVAFLPVSKLGRDVGALVSSVLPGSPAEKGGLRAGDVVISVGSQPVDVRFFEQVPVLYQQIADLPIGKVVEIRYERDGKAATASVAVAKMERFTGEEDEFRRLGITIQGITGPMALSRRYPDQNGVVLTGVRPGYPFEEARPQVQSGDVITRVGDAAIADLASFRAAIAAVKDRKSFPVEVRRDRERILTVVEVKEDKPKTSQGELGKPWLGVETQVCTPKVAEALGVQGTKGFRVTLVHEGTEASKAGLRAGDILTAIEGDALDAYRPQDAADLKRRLEDYSIGKPVEFSVLRDGKKTALRVVLEKPPMPAGEAKTARDKELEYSVRDLVFEDRTKRHWGADRTGVVVAEVTRGSFANVAGLHTDDVLASVNGTPVTDVASFEKATAAVQQEKPKVVRLFVHRGFETHFVLVEPDWAALSRTK